MKRISVSLPDELAGKVKEISRRTGLKISQIVSESINCYVELNYPELSTVKVKIYPTVLWKIRGRKATRGPSPTLRRGKIGEWKLIDIDKLQL